MSNHLVNLVTQQALTSNNYTLKTIPNMKTKTPYIQGLCLLFVHAVLSSCTPESRDVAAEISEANKGFMQAFASADPSAMGSLYTENAKLYPANSDVVVGRKDIESFWGSVMKMGIKKAELSTLTAESIGNTAVEEGTYKLFVGEDLMVDQGKYIVTWQKENGQWKLHRDIWNTNIPAPQPRASVNDTVFVISNYIKPDKVEQFEEFNFKYLEPATAEYYPKMRSTVRTLRATEQNKDKTYTYYYLMDAATSPDGYDMTLPLTAKYGEAKAKEYLTMFEDCLKDRKQEMVKTVQTTW